MLNISCVRRSQFQKCYIAVKEELKRLRTGLNYQIKPKIDSAVKTHHFDNEASKINVTSSTEGDDQQSYNKHSDAMHYMESNVKKHVY